MERITDTYLTRDGGAQHSISYNLLNLPKEVLFEDGHEIRYTYAADGRKLKTEYIINNFSIIDVPGDDIVIGPGFELGNGLSSKESAIVGGAGTQNAGTLPSGEIEEPIGGIEILGPVTQMTRTYCGNHIYRNGVLERVLNDVGYADSTGYHYQVKDYRGDVRAVVAQNGMLEETNSYYPYGMLHGISAIASTQPYKYTGKELERENGLDWYDFEARMLMSDLGRTTTPDPLAEKYYSISPYVWCAGNPNSFVDPQGLSWMVATYGDDIFYYYESSINSQEDIYKKYGKDSNLVYLGKENFSVKHVLEDIVGINLTKDGNIDINGKDVLEYDKENLHIGNIENVKFDKDNNREKKNFFDYHYLGSNNPKIGDKYSYSIAPINWQDYAAYKHDLAYDQLQAEGIMGVLSLRTTMADIDLILRSSINFICSPLFSKQQFVSFATAISFSGIVGSKINKPIW